MPCSCRGFDSALCQTSILIYNDDIEYSYQVDIFDFYRLLEIVENNDQENCGHEAGDLTGEGDVNIFDVYAFVGLIMD